MCATIPAVLCFLLSILLFVNGGENDIKDEHSLELTQSLNLARQELIAEKCRRSPPRYTLEDLSPSQLEHILIDEEHKLLYCYVPKVSSSRLTACVILLNHRRLRLLTYVVALTEPTAQKCP